MSQTKFIVIITEERRQAIEKAITESEISLSKIAESVGLSKSNLSRVKRGDIKSMSDILYMVLEHKYLLPYLDEKYRHVKMPDDALKQWKISIRTEFDIDIDLLEKENEEIKKIIAIKEIELNEAYKKLKVAEKEAKQSKSKFNKLIKTINEI